MTRRYFEGQTAIVTGAGAGMGREHALLLAARGASVVVNDISPSGQEVVDRIVGDGGRAVLSAHDVADPASADALVRSAVDAFGGLHIVISNAGIIRAEPFEQLSLEDFDRVMKVNAYGAFNVLHAAWPHLIGQQYGRVVMVSSASAFLPIEGLAAYAASKGTVLGLGMTLAAEATRHGITVNMLAPGATTQMSGANSDEEARRIGETMLPAALVAPVVGWLVRPANTLNGRIIEAAAGRAALDFVGSTRGFWKQDLTIEDLVEHETRVFDEQGFKHLADPGTLSTWMTEGTTGWPEILAKQATIS